ncbi:MAG: hypothetical protein K6G75_10975 [Lachnospiraceae bacterium]|nr:hypothetical protein [Lachnospiraceae bacterium]
MSKNACRIIGFVLMIVSVFLIMGGLYLPQAGVIAIITVPCLVAGILLFAVGIVFYKILKTD